MGAAAPISRRRPIRYMNWETVNPLWWCPRGYALAARRHARLGQVARQVGAELVPGRRSTPTTASSGSRSAAGATGNVGTLGISYHAAFQWRVANLQPPSLKAIMPWEGRADQYRDQAYHGGIFAMGFIAQLVPTATPRTTCSASRAATTPTRSTTTSSGTTCATTSTPSTGGMNSARWDRIKVPLYSVGNWGGFSHAPARQHRGLHVRRVEAQEAAHPHRHALPPVPRRGGAHRPAALVRLLAEGHRHRHHGRAAGEARDPHRRQHEAVPVPLRERMAARAHAVDEVLSARSTARRSDRARRPSKARSSPKPPKTAARRSSYPPGAGTSRPAKTPRGRVVRDAADEGGHRDHRAASCSTCGCRARSKDMDIFATIRNIDPDGQGRVRGGPAGRAGRVRDQGVAARLAPQARPGEVAAVPPVPRARRALVAEARRDRRVPGRDLADLHGVQERATSCGSTSRRATAWARSTSRTTTRTTTRAARRPSIPAGRRSRTCCCR